MSIEITMPRLSDTMESGTLIKWHVQVGDTVSSGDLLADVETDKATMPLESYDDGTVAKLAMGENQEVPVGQLILVLAEDGESVEQVAGAASSSSAPEEAAPVAIGSAAGAAQPQAVAAAPAVAPAGRLKISPVARKLAEEHGLEMAAIRGSGPDGRVIKRDVLALVGQAPPPTESQIVEAVEPATPPMAPSTTDRLVRLNQMRKTIARRLVESKTTIPHFTVTVQIDMDALADLRRMLNEQLAAQKVKLSVNDFIVRAAALALQVHGAVNASWTDAGVQYHSAAHVGVAVALPVSPDGTGGGLVVPVIRDADHKGLRQINGEARHLAAKARGQGLSADDMAAGTFTVSNLGMFGVEHFEAIINPPQAAILAVGAALEQPVVRDGQLTVGQRMTCTLSADHRIVDGATAAQFLQSLKQSLEQPAVMLV